jgi:chromosome segregation ATPase
VCSFFTFLSFFRNAELNSKLQALQVEVSSLQQTRNDNNQEIQTLKDCLDQLVVSTGSHTGEQEEMTGGQTQNVNPAGTLLKIQAMLDTTKVQAELQAVTVERDSNISALEEQTRLVKKLQEENTSLREHSNEIEAQLSVCTADLQKLQEKHKTLTEYFEQKEHNLHRMLGAEEAVRQAVESREAQVKEKAQSLEQAETRHREELKQLRSEMFEIEKSLMSQVHTCQKRAEDAIAEQRRLEQECKALKLERDDLRKRMTVKSVSHLGGASDSEYFTVNHDNYI